MLSSPFFLTLRPKTREAEEELFILNRKREAIYLTNVKR